MCPVVLHAYIYIFRQKLAFCYIPQCCFLLCSLNIMFLSSVWLLGVYLICCFQLLHRTPWCHGVYFLSSLPVTGILHWLQLSSTPNDTSVNILVHVPLWSWRIPLSYTLRSGFCLSGSRLLTLRSAVPVFPPTSRAQRAPFPHCRPNTWHHPAL